MWDILIMYGPGLVVKLALGFLVWLRAYDGTMYKPAKVKLVMTPGTYNEDPLNV